MDFMVMWAQENRVFRRNKIPVEKKLLAGIMDSSGLSFREIASLLGEISYVGVRDAQLAVKKALPLPARKHRGRIALTESTLDLGGTQFQTWLARDLDNSEILAVHATRNPSPEESDRFLDRVLQQCNNRPMAVVDRGENYPKYLRKLDVKFQIDTSTGIRERLGRFFGVGKYHEQAVGA